MLAVSRVVLDASQGARSREEIEPGASSSGSGLPVGRAGGAGRVLRLATAGTVAPPPDGRERVLSARRRLGGSAPSSSGDTTLRRANDPTVALSVRRSDCPGTRTIRRTGRPRRQPGQLAADLHRGDDRRRRHRDGHDHDHLHRLLLAADAGEFSQFFTTKYTPMFRNLSRCNDPSKRFNCYHRFVKQSYKLFISTVMLKLH